MRSKRRRQKLEIYRDVIALCPALGNTLRLKANANSYYLRNMIEEGFLTAGWEENDGFSERRRGRVKVYRATDKGMELMQT